MNIFEYLTRNCKDKPYFDEAGNVYVDVQSGIDRHVRYFMQRIDEDCFFLTKEDYEKYAKIEISLANDIDDSFYNVRRPYFRLRGKPVTREQAYEILRRVDRFFNNIDSVYSHDDFIECLNFRSNVLPNRSYSDRWGWCHPDGFIGINDITFKYPEDNEFIAEWVKYLAEFSFLDIMIAITNWDEIPPEVWDKMSEDLFYTNDNWDADDTYDGLFLKSIYLGIYVHDNKVELLNSTDARARYIEYDALYGSQKARCSVDYCEENGIYEADLGYVRKCIESYGLDADEELAKLPECFLEVFEAVESLLSYKKRGD